MSKFLECYEEIMTEVKTAPAKPSYKKMFKEGSDEAYLSQWLIALGVDEDDELIDELYSIALSLRSGPASKIIVKELNDAGFSATVSEVKTALVKSGYK